MNISSVSFNKRSVKVVWEKFGTTYISVLYRHSDYSWHLDSDTANMYPKLKEELQEAVIRYLSIKESEKNTKRYKSRRRDVWLAD